MFHNGLRHVYQQKISETRILRVGFADVTARTLADITILEGSFPENSNEIALTEGMANALDKKALGDQVEVADSKYTISGILMDYGHLWPQSEEQRNKNIGPLNAFITEQEANRIFQQTNQLSRQILIVRQLGVSNPTENDSHLLRNTNNTLENRKSFSVPNEFAILMMIALLISVLMILMLNRKRLTTRIRNYYNLGLCKSDINIIICFELIFLGIIGSILGIVFGCGISMFVLNSLQLYSDQPIPLYINWNIISILFLSAIISIALLTFIYSKYAIAASLRENAARVDRYSKKAQKVRLLRFEVKQNRRSMFALSCLVILSFCLLSFGVFYNRYFCSDVYEQPAGMLPKDYDFLFCTRPLPSVPNNGQEIPFYFTDTYEKIGGDHDFVEQLKLLPAVERVNAYKEINKMNVLITENQIDPYIDAHDFARDKQYSMRFQTNIEDMDYFREQFGYQDQEILVGAEILTYPADILKSLEDSVVEGKINLARIASGDEIVLRVPAYKIERLDSGMVLKSPVSGEQEGAYNSTTFQVGDEIHLSGILTDELINGPVVKSQADSFYRKDIIVKVGAIIRNTDGLLSSSGSFGKAFSILSLDEALPIYGLNATYSNVSVYTKPGYSTEEISQLINGLSNQVPNMIIEDFQKEVQTYKIYKLMIDIYVTSLSLALAIATLIIMASQLLARTRLNMKNNALLRINGVSLWRIVRLWLLQVSVVVSVGCLIGVPLSLLLFCMFEPLFENLQ